jgi:hypothetical protein
MNGASGFLSSVSWIHNASGYSFGSYEFLTPANGASYKIENPKGLTVCGYGTGDKESYYYVAASATHKLNTDILINERSYKDVDGGFLCDSIVEFDLSNVYDMDPANPLKWELNGIEVTHYQGVTKWDTILPPGYYTLNLTVYPLIGAMALNYSCTFGVAPRSVVWTPESNTTGSDIDKQNWNNPANWTPSIVPTECVDVYIPGVCSHYPQLSDTVFCKHIYFAQGGELGRPDFLTYDQAHVDLNFDLLAPSSAQVTESGIPAFLSLANNNDSITTADRLIFSASTSVPLGRERWYALAAPLRDMVSGDFGFGAFPLTFLKKFGPITKDGAPYLVGSWTDTYISYAEKFSPTEGFGFYMYGYDNVSGSTSARNNGCLEAGNYDDLNDLAYFPERSGHPYGLQQTNGILEFPFYQDSLLLEAHRTQAYDPALNTSTFYYFSKPPYNIEDVNEIIPDSYLRESNKGSYRFIPENYTSGKWVFANPVYHPGSGLGSSDEFLAGNPYISSINIVEFLRDNQTLLEPQYRIWNGNDFTSYHVDLSTGLITTPASPDIMDYYIAPMQGFFLTTQSGYAGANIAFDVQKISTVRPANSQLSNLRSGDVSPETNMLRIQAENEYAVSRLIISHKDDAENTFKPGEDVRKLFSPSVEIPEIYSLAEEIPTEINFIDITQDVTVPVGIRTEYLGTVHLTFTGMDHYTQTTKIFFLDIVEGKEFELTGMDNFTYPFDNQVTGIQNGRFFIRFSNMPTGQSIVEDNNILVYAGSFGISVSSPDPIRQISLYDMEGRKIYENTRIGKNSFLINEPVDLQSVIVRVITTQGSKSVKARIIK